jgi:hypothetical protein
MSEVTMDRLDDQINWYNSKSKRNQSLFKWLKVLEIIIAAAIPLAASVWDNNLFPGACGVSIVIIEGVQGVFQFQHNWIVYRATCESLKHEKYLYLAGAGPYLAIDNPLAILAERVESLISQEHSKWIAQRQKSCEKTS